LRGRREGGRKRWGKGERERGLAELVMVEMNEKSEV